MKRVVAVPCLLLLEGCATVFEGTDQTVQINASPKSTICVAKREGVSIGSTSASNNTIQISKSRHDIFLTCSAPGYQEATTKMVPSASVGGVASVFFFDFGLTDYATGALNKYSKSVTVNLLPLGAGPAPRRTVRCRTSSGVVRLTPLECRKLSGSIVSR
jgi:hypothetical protein